MRALVRAAIVLAALVPTAARAGLDTPEPDGTPRLLDAVFARTLQSAVRPTGVSAAAETVWVGHRAGWNGNFWSVGTGPARGSADTDGMWTWDAPVHGDSLQGWWPLRAIHSNSAGPVLTDEQRPWWALEIGNQADQVTAQGRFDVARLGTAWPGNRTFGVVGVWHADPGNTGAGANQGVHWTPLTGARSAWMGLRRHGDLTAADPLTSNPFNADVLMFNGRAGGATSNKTYPGYAGQMDQMLYRDIDLTGAPADSGVRIAFRYRTQMSTLKGTLASLRTGWYEGDPLTLNGVTPGNFISAEAGSPAGSRAPVDSFQVYVGAPVEGTWLGSDGAMRPVHDPLRRWFNEVLRRDARHWRFARAGTDSGVVTVALSKAEKDALVAAAGAPRIRLVFRVHTNRGYDDESGASIYTSNGRGAAQVDDVQVNAGAGWTVIGDFEGGDPSRDIDNTRPATQAWRSTGKPPSVAFHAHDLASLAWDDLCGPVGGPNRMCDMSGVVISMGEHDAGEATAGAAGTPDAAGTWGMVSPTVCLKAQPGIANGWGLTLEQATATGDYLLAYQVYTGALDPWTDGGFWQLGAQSYPAQQADGAPTWGDIRVATGTYFDASPECFRAFEPLRSGGLVLTSNAGGIPDSLRIYLQRSSQCYRFGITAGCGPASGAYFDDVSLAIVDAAPPVDMQVDIRDWLQDAFPANEDPALPGTAAFDTTAALVRTGANIAQTTGTTFRFDVPGDSVVVVAQGADVRIDLVFRILPGPGNHVVIGDRASGLRRVPTDPARATAGDASFWGQYMATPGQFATAGAAARHAAWPGGWDPHVWMSARCDTAQVGLFPLAERGIGDYPDATGTLDGTRWMSTYHEADPHIAALGIPRHECFLVDTLSPANSYGITCSTVPAWITTLPMSFTGYDGDPITVEGTSILPDGLFTPGTHVQYFFRRSAASDPAGAFTMLPDTTRVWPQTGEGSLDAHRWQTFAVLPDRWKDAAFGGAGMACMLVVDWADRRGDETAWTGVADSIGATAAAKRGAHDGWAAPGGADPNDPAHFVAAHGGQPGTTWDLYGVKAGEAATAAAGTLGARLAHRDATPGNRVDGKDARQAPTPAMLAAYYPLVLLLAGDLASNVLGPFADRSADDEGLLTQHLQGATVAHPRALAAMGDGFVSSETGSALLSQRLGAAFVHTSYRELAGDPAPNVPLVSSAELDPAGVRIAIADPCATDLDVVDVDPALPEAAVVSWYQGAGGTHPAAVHKPATAERPWLAYAGGFRIEALRGMLGASTAGRRLYLGMLLANLFGAVCAPTGAPLGVDGGGPAAAALTDFARIAGNPARHGTAAVVFGLAAADRVDVRLYDVSGRLVRRLAERVFPAGEHRLAWDGRDDAGAVVRPGAYFARVRYAGRGFEAVRRVIVLR